MPVRIATSEEAEDWARLRAQLWPDTSPDEHRRDIEAILSDADASLICWIHSAEDGAPLAFAEAAIRNDHVNGCDTSPVAFLEGIYVRPEHRGRGIGRDLVLAVQAWALEQGCTELASDALLTNVDSHAFHEAAGFEETERVVYFRKAL